jgi:4-hydroxy-tetrahydrodipicolinate reductase
MNQKARAAPYRVVQWATGTFGTRSLRCVIDHPDLELVGVRVYSADKEGIDAGALCDTAPVGIAAGRSIEEVIALAPDCVLYMPKDCDVDDVCRLLESGINIVTTIGEFLGPTVMDQDLRKRTEAACQRGGSSIHCTGSSPGFVTEALPIVLLSLQRRFDDLLIDEFSNIGTNCSADTIFDVLGFGLPQEEFSTRPPPNAKRWFYDSFASLAEAISLPLDQLTMSHEIALARTPIQVLDRVLAAGTVAAQRFRIEGLRNGRPRMTFRANWYCSTDVDKDWNLREPGWRVTVNGDAPVVMDVMLPRPLEDVIAGRLPRGGYTAHRPVNAVRYVCEAPPGILTTADLPQIIPHFSED